MTNSEPRVNVQRAVALFMVTNIDASLKFYIEGIGFEMKNTWVPNGKIEWCWLEIGNAALMLQELRGERANDQKRGEGVSLNFVCTDALQLYRQFIENGLTPKEPFVGNRMWVVSLVDPDGYHIYFESPTDVPEETTLSNWQNRD